jgi:hypothetical protein
VKGCILGFVHGDGHFEGSVVHLLTTWRQLQSKLVVFSHREEHRLGGIRREKLGPEVGRQVEHQIVVRSTI